MPVDNAQSNNSTTKNSTVVVGSPRAAGTAAYGANFTIDATINLNQELATANESNNTKYQKIGHDEGKLISAYYTLGHEEKNTNFK